MTTPGQGTRLQNIVGRVPSRGETSVVMYIKRRRGVRTPPPVPAYRGVAPPAGSSVLLQGGHPLSNPGYIIFLAGRDEHRRGGNSLNRLRSAGI